MKAFSVKFRRLQLKKVKQRYNHNMIERETRLHDTKMQKDRSFQPTIFFSFSWLQICLVIRHDRFLSDLTDDLFPWMIDGSFINFILLNERSEYAEDTGRQTKI